MLEDFDLKQKAGGWDKWVHVIAAERRREHNTAATNINRVVRGFMGRRRVLNICTGRAAIEIQRVTRGRMGRKRYARVWQAHREEWAAMVIQVRYRGYKGKQLGKVIMMKKRRYDAACVLQRAWRGFEGRRITRLIAEKKRELEAVLYIQNAWRTRVARKLVANMRSAIAEEESALYIQAWWRAVGFAFAWTLVQSLVIVDGFKALCVWSHYSVGNLVGVAVFSTLRTPALWPRAPSPHPRPAATYTGSISTHDSQRTSGAGRCFVVAG